ncbi:putative RNA recognition motif domain, ataxin-2, RNA-binding domain superfamily [Arabidopsis thaliana]
MAFAENVGVKVDSSNNQNIDNNTTSLVETKPSCSDDQTPKSKSSVLTNELIQRTSEVNLKSEISHLNPMAKEFVPSFLAQTHHSEFWGNRFWFTNHFPKQTIFLIGQFATMRRNFGKGRPWINRKTNLAQNEDVIKRTVYVSDIDNQVTEEQLASLFLSCGQVRVFLFYGFGELLPIGSDSDVGEASWVVNPATGASGSGGNGWTESAANDPAREVSLAPFPPQLTHPVPFPAEPGSPDPVSPPPPIASFFSRIERAESLHAGNIELTEDLQRIQEMERNLENERSPYRGRELAARIDWEVRELEGKVARNRAWDMVRDAQLDIWRQGLDQELVRQQENESRLEERSSPMQGARSALRKSGTMFGSHPIRVFMSKTAIAPVNPSFLPQSKDELEKCGKTVYCTNIDKEVTKMELENFFKAVCGEVHHLRLLGDFYHQTRIAFVEFKLAESAISALNCSGVVLGELPIRVSPSKTPVRLHHSDLN